MPQNQLLQVPMELIQKLLKSVGALWGKTPTILNKGGFSIPTHRSCQCATCHVVSCGLSPTMHPIKGILKRRPNASSELKPV
eukprot:6434917-Amphidinium_carterae.1